MATTTTSTDSGRRRPRVVVGVDGSDPSRLALTWAIDEAVRIHADLDVVHAWHLPYALGAPLLLPLQVDAGELKTLAKELLTTSVRIGLGRTSSRPANIEELIVEGTAAASLLNVAAGADLLVLGSRGLGGFAGLLLGSVSHQCLHHAPCPVAIVRHWRDTGRIVVGSDGSDDSDAAVRWAVAEAARQGAPIEVIASWSWSDDPHRVINVPPESDEARRIVGHDVARASAHVPEAANVDVTIRIVDEDPGSALVDASTDARMVVVGTRQFGAVRRAVYGSVSDYCAHHAHCPVVVVRKPHDD